MNIYDTKPIKCVRCGKSIGEIEYDAEVINPKCGYCANPLPDGFDKLSYSAHHIKSMSTMKLVPA
jgi:hypothetical protein